MGHVPDTDRDRPVVPDAAEDVRNTESEAISATETPAEDDLDDLEFLLEEIENRIAPLA
jgi:hypothetical protein